MRDAELSELLLRWYDRNARIMPWRVSPQDRKAGMVPDPYRIWLSEVMLQQTTVAAVKDYFHRFTARWPTVSDLAAARDEDVMAEWAGLGYYARARNLLKAARAVVAEHGGVFPGTRDGLIDLAGIGPYTASAVASIAYDEAATVVDGNVERVMARLFCVQTPLPVAKVELTTLAASLTPDHRPGDYAQAVMDLGATICTPRNPACGICPWNHACLARREGVQSELPRKMPKAEKPVRRGMLWLVTQNDNILVQRRPDKGLLGGMLGFPGNDWDGVGGEAPAVAEWQDIGEIRHTFTHFQLYLTLYAAELPVGTAVTRGQFVSHNVFSPADLPTVMRKAYDRLQDTLSRCVTPRF